MAQAGGDCEDASCADFKRTGEHGNARFGCCVASAGWVTSGDKEDIIVGASKNKTDGPRAGRAFAFKNSNVAPLLTIDGDNKGDGFGTAVAGAGDLNGDGHDDLIIGAPYNDARGVSAGRIYAYSGSDHALLWSRKGLAAGDHYGWSVAGAGDVNNDGVGDVIAGAPWNDAGGNDAGRVHVLSGATGSLIWSINGEAEFDHFGSAVTGIGDVNDDGYDDFAVSAPENDAIGPDSGRAYIYSGLDKSVLQFVEAEGPGVHFGTSMAARRFTFNGQLYTSFLVGIIHDDQGGGEAGHIHAYVRNHDDPHCADLFCQIYIYNGEAAGDHLGQSVAVGQMMGNEVPELVAGAPMNDGGGEDAGRVYIWHATWVPTTCCVFAPLEKTITGEAAGDQFGASVAVADINNDGLNDLVVGAPFNDAGGSNAGRVYVFVSAQSQ